MLTWTIFVSDLFCNSQQLSWKSKKCTKNIGIIDFLLNIPIKADNVIEGCLVDCPENIYSKYLKKSQ